MPARRFTDKEENEIAAMYWSGETTVSLGARFDCRDSVIRSAVRRQGGELRTRAEAARLSNPHEPTEAEADALVASYGEGISISQLKKRTGRNYRTIKRLLTERGIELRDDSDISGPRSWNWAGGRSRTSQGYVMVWLPEDHPFACMRNKTRKVCEHRLVWAEHLGRPLHPWEEVHHKNKVRDDNRLENLELWLTRQPVGARIEDLIDFYCEHYREAVQDCLAGRQSLFLVPSVRRPVSA